MLGRKIVEFYAALPQPGDDSVQSGSEIYSIGMTPCYASLVIVASHNWMPSTHSNHVSEPRAKLIYKLSYRSRVDFGQLVYDQVMGMSKSNTKTLVG
ncbi:unnamed protein product [Microthlaspi erraticum]|uniref:Uncharacterized protein n=1 Tax=Microthlaspi erraticum TaxID=1685480 RepID=A0A6D2IYE8_9BRAS|nr:unnamed protein product [Microthlaspi erraticum]